jgi:hypothetical protein
MTNPLCVPNLTGGSAPYIGSGRTESFTSNETPKGTPGLVSLGRACLGLALLGSGLGCSRDPEPPAEGKAAVPTHPSQSKPSSSRYENADFRLEILEAHQCTPEPPFLPEAGHERMSITIRVASRSRSSIPVQALAFRLEAESGEKHAPTPAGCRPALSVSTLADGQTALGDVAFDVPVHAGPLTLVYEPFVIGREPVVVRVNVPDAGPPPQNQLQVRSR